MSNQLNRRQLLGLTGMSLGTLAASSVTNSGLKNTLCAAENPPEPEYWKYVPVDPKTAAERAYEAYADGSCMYAAFLAIIETVGKKILESDPRQARKYLDFPFFMMKYGRGGTLECGSLCGALNGCAAAIGLLVEDKASREAMGAELFHYYETTTLPVFVSSRSPEVTIPRTVSHSVLCHVSNTTWCLEADVDVESANRKERCKRLTADVVLKTLELLNRYVQSELPPNERKTLFTPLTGDTAACAECHNPKGSDPKVSCKMTCATCHEDKFEEAIPHYPQ